MEIDSFSLEVSMEIMENIMINLEGFSGKFSLDFINIFFCEKFKGLIFIVKGNALIFKL
jgi:hypothetical protein